MASPLVARVPYSRLVYDRRAARYRAPNGRFLAPSTVRSIIEADIEATKGRMESLAKRCQSGELSAEQWRDLMAVEVKSLHLANLAAAKGGFHALDQSDFGRCGQVLREQYGYLNRRALTVAGDPAYRESDRFLRDVSWYADAGLSTYEAQRAVEEERAGFHWEFNELESSAIHCKPRGGRESCKQQTDKGVVRTGALVRFGYCACGPACRCTRRRFRSFEAATAAYEAMI